MGFFNPLWIAVSTYTVLPAPRVEWTRENTRRAVCFLPVAGVLPALALPLWHWICHALNAGPVLFGAVAAVLPPLLTGGLHMDGFMDTADALGSRRDRERKLEIMKDPHVGAFGVMACGAGLLVCFGLYTALYRSGAIWVVCAGFVFSRAVAAATALALPHARSAGMLHAMAENSGRAAAALGLLALLCAAGMAALNLRSGLVAAVLGGVCTLWYRHMAIRQFGGVTGDTSGFFLVLCELAILCGAWLGSCL